ncbi:MAG TPA: gas vesicle protein GvpO, partial [Gaiellaceae bacterium]|nr:gas vesicle protein GvpO [Gaiellaceae bacterium]
EEPQAETEEPQAESEEPHEQEEQEPEPEQEPEQEHQPEQEPEQEQPAEEPVAGAGPSEARQALDRAREQLQDLLEQPVEKVSSLERTHDGWVAQLGVVELTRIPESTDVMGSYELELDDELNLRRYQQARRYTRSQASRDEGA